jgi:hypothetical protein
VVLCEGEITGELSREEATEEKIMLLATSVVEMKGHNKAQETQGR